jgi:recombination protein RecT
MADDNKHPLVAFRGKFEMRRSELIAALPPGTSADAFIRAVMTSAQINPDILACNFASIWNACMKACREGLLPDGIEAALVPYKTSATYVPMYQGQMRNFRRSGKFKWIDADLVRKGEVFEYWKTQDGVHFKHAPGEDHDAPVVRVYAIATTTDGTSFVAVLRIEEIEKIKRKSPNTRPDGPWQQWEEWMMKKTAIKQLSKMLPTLRDLMPEDEYEPPDVGIAGGPPAAPPAPPEQIAAASVTADSGQKDDVVDQSAPGNGEAAPEKIAAAFDQGRLSRAAGMTRMVPTEFRGNARIEESRAWRRGWDEPPEELRT